MLIKMDDVKDYVGFFNTEIETLELVKNGCFRFPEEISKKSTIWCLYYKKDQWKEFKTKKEALKFINNINKLLKNEN